MARLLRWFYTLVALLAGCADPGDHRSIWAPTAAHPRRDATRDATYLVHDFGVTLSRGQSLHYQFELKNPTRRPIRILNCEALSPCCSSIDPPSRPVISPGEAIQLGVTLHP